MIRFDERCWTHTTDVHHDPTTASIIYKKYICSHAETMEMQEVKASNFFMPKETSHREGPGQKLMDHHEQICSV